MPEDESGQELSGTIPTVGVLLLRNDNTEVLLVKHTENAQNRTGIYGLPAGRIQPGETPREAAIRELEEETGLQATEDDLAQYEGNFFAADLERHYQNESILRRANMIVYRCGDYSGELRGSKETEMPEWVAISRIPELEMMPNIDLAINNYLKTVQQ